MFIASTVCLSVRSENKGAITSEECSINKDRRLFSLDAKRARGGRRRVYHIDFQSFTAWIPLKLGLFLTFLSPFTGMHEQSINGFQCLTSVQIIRCSMCSLSFVILCCTLHIFNRCQRSRPSRWPIYRLWIFYYKKPGKPYVFAFLVCPHTREGWCSGREMALIAIPRDERACMADEVLLHRTEARVHISARSVTQT